MENPLLIRIINKIVLKVTKALEIKVYLIFQLFTFYKRFDYFNVYWMKVVERLKTFTVILFNSYIRG